MRAKTKKQNHTTTNKGLNVQRVHESLNKYAHEIPPGAKKKYVT